MKKFTEWMNLTEGMNDYAKDMDVKEKIKKYKNLADNYNVLFKSNKDHNSPSMFLLLHSMELLLKQKYLEKFGEMDLKLEKSHDLSEFMKKLGVYNKETKIMCELDPHMVRFRYPTHLKNEDLDMKKIKKIYEKLWRKLNGV